MNEEEVDTAFIDSPETAAANALATSDAHLVPPDPRFVVEKIGSIPYGPGGPYSGCKVMQWEAITETDGTVPAHVAMNEFFDAHQNLMVAQMWVSSDGMCITAMVTNTLTDAQLRVVNVRARIIEEMVQEEIKKEQAYQEEAEAKVVTEEKRLQELAKVGEHCAANHGAVVKRLKGKK